MRAEIRLNGRSGQAIWLDVDYQPIHDAQGVTTGCSIVATDITEPVNQRLKMRALLDALPAGVVLQAANGEVTECNQAATELLALRRDRLVVDRAGAQPAGLLPRRAVHGF